MRVGVKVCKRSGLDLAALKTRIELGPANANGEPECVKPIIVDESMDELGREAELTRGAINIEPLVAGHRTDDTEDDQGKPFSS